MRLNWIRTFEKIDNHNLQEMFIEQDMKLQKAGRHIRFCLVCRRWVSIHDFIHYCKEGYHEYSEGIEIAPKHKGQLGDKLS